MDIPQPRQSDGQMARDSLAFQCLGRDLLREPEVCAAAGLPGQGSGAGEIRQRGADAGAGGLEAVAGVARESRHGRPLRV